MSWTRKILQWIFVLAVLGIIANYIWMWRTPAMPTAHIQLVGYEIRQDSIVATVVLTNTGSSALNYDDSSGGVYYSVLARVEGIVTNISSGGGPSSMAGPIVVWPSHTARIRIFLPSRTESWSCTIPVQGTGARIRVLMRLGEWGIWDRLYPVSLWFTRLFPLNDSPEIKIQSNAFMVSTNASP